MTKIAESVFALNSDNIRLCQASLRDRFCLLLTNFGILRGESLFKADLSDLASIIEKRGTCQETVVLILQIAIGKVNKGKTLYGRVMRHRDVELCPVGALALYLFYRFQVAKEELDLSANSKWFDVKLLLGTNSTDHTKAMHDQQYAKTIKKVCSELGLVTSHFVHFGRAVGLVTGEYNELSGEELKNLGNWNVDTMEDRYSAKVPYPTMRVMAGQPKEKNLYHLQEPFYLMKN
jgi:hypothetical protein